VRISARIDPNEDNRLLAVAADAEEFYRSSEIQLNGAEAPKTIELRFPSLPAGDYEIAAALIDSSGHPRAVVRQTARILPTLTSLTTPPSSLLALNESPSIRGRPRRRWVLVEAVRPPFSAIRGHTSHLHRVTYQNFGVLDHRCLILCLPGLWSDHSREVSGRM
jgi:hypothetical protein